MTEKLWSLSRPWLGDRGRCALGVPRADLFHSPHCHGDALGGMGVREAGVQNLLGPSGVWSFWWVPQPNVHRGNALLQDATDPRIYTG